MYVTAVKLYSTSAKQNINNVASNCSVFQFCHKCGMKTAQVGQEVGCDLKVCRPLVVSTVVLHCQILLYYSISYCITSNPILHGPTFQKIQPNY
jgi:hypothetical protein